MTEAEFAKFKGDDVGEFGEKPYEHKIWINAFRLIGDTKEIEQMIGAQIVKLLRGEHKARVYGADLIRVEVSAS